MFGGLALNVNHLQPGVQGLPGSGSDLAAELMTRVTDLGVEMLFEPVTSVQPASDGSLHVATAVSSHSAHCVVVASGARMRKLGVPGEDAFEKRGVSQCADCDAPLHKGQTVVVVGGGDSALQETLVLAEFCSDVHLVHRRSAFGGRSEFAEAVRSSPRVHVHLGTVVDAIVGDQYVTGVRLRRPASGETSELPCNGIFPYVGLEPNTDFLAASLKIEGGSVRVDGKLETSWPNVFAVGAVRAGYAGQLTDAVRDAMGVVETISSRRLGHA